MSKTVIDKKLVTNVLTALKNEKQRDPFGPNVGHESQVANLLNLPESTVKRIRLDGSWAAYERRRAARRDQAAITKLHTKKLEEAVAGTVARPKLLTVKQAGKNLAKAGRNQGTTVEAIRHSDAKTEPIRMKIDDNGVVTRNGKFHTLVEIPKRPFWQRMFGRKERV